MSENITYETNGETLILKPLPLGFLEKNLNKIRTIHTMDDKEAITFIADTIHFSISKTQPDITREKLVDDILDFKNVYLIFNKLMEISGIVSSDNIGENSQKKI